MAETQPGSLALHAEAAGDMMAAADPRVQASLRYCHQVTRARARNFYYGLKLTPQPRRSAVYAVYAFMRACDDLVDQPPAPGSAGGGASRESADAGLARIEAFRADMEAALRAPAGAALPAGEFWPAFRHVARAYVLDPAHLHAMLDGQRLDLVRQRCQTFQELYDYCYKVASVVGLVCIRIWGAGESGPALKLAEYRGIALQLTNILRDVVEDAGRGRVYLPAEELERFGYKPEGFRERAGGAAFDRLMRFQIDRARGYYDMSRGLEHHLAPECRATCWTLMQLYRSLLEKIAADPRQVLARRVSLSVWRKLAIAAAGLRMR